ncbi:SDR family oxidoreductase [Streptomyces sp. NPDC048558]|uniref:SDR family oxidoreductase n=1 Tax=Streptomyces sp. NPDC048558 TaxID=3155759 RepID=UPI0033C13874
MGMLAGRTALVTGASRGIGRAIAERLAHDGARVAVHFGRNEAAAKETVTAIETAGGSAFAVRAELGVPGDAETLWEAFDRHAQGVDILVNNAGMAIFATIGETDEEAYARTQAVNAKAPFFIVKHGLGRLRDHGRIINVTAATDYAVAPIAATHMAKGAVTTLTRSLAAELAPRGITANSVGPGFIDTDLTSAALADPGIRGHAEGVSVFKRVGTSSDVADVAAFLASADSRWVTGQHIDATGGSLLSLH